MSERGKAVTFASRKWQIQFLSGKTELALAGQFSLFDSSVSYGMSVPLTLTMGKEVFLSWKQKIASYQNVTRTTNLAVQSNLWAEPESFRQIDPFGLPLQPLEFYRLPTTERGSPSIYFILDTTAHLVLYIGETCHANLRWKGQHDCKQYIQNYQNLHYSHNLPITVNAAFWLHAPVATKARQQLERELIYQWRSPFNKEVWQYWGKPF